MQALPQDAPWWPRTASHRFVNMKVLPRIPVFNNPLPRLPLRVTTHRECSFQLAGDCAEAVEHKVLSHAVDPLPTGRQRATHKVATFSFTGAETPHDLYREVGKPGFTFGNPNVPGPAHGAGCGLTWPCMFMMTTVLERLHTTKCSGFLGSRRMLLTVMSVPADVPRGLKVLVHSVVFMFHTWNRSTRTRHTHTHTHTRVRGFRRGSHGVLP